MVGHGQQRGERAALFHDDHALAKVAEAARDAALGDALVVAAVEHGAPCRAVLCQHRLPAALIGAVVERGLVRVLLYHLYQVKVIEGGIGSRRWYTAVGDN